MSKPTGAEEQRAELSAVDALMHRAEANPRGRSGMIGLDILDVTPDWERFRAVAEAASRSVPRLRQKVVIPSLPTAPPRWVVDPDFNLDFHLRRVHLPQPGTMRALFDLVEVTAQSPFDTSRALWSITLIEGLEDGRAAVMAHLSHAITDGMGSVDMFARLYDLEREAPAPTFASEPVPQRLSPHELAVDGIAGTPARVAKGIAGALRRSIDVGGRVARDPGAVSDAVRYAQSAARMTGKVADPSPLLANRSLTSRTEALDMELSDLRLAGKAAGGSVNDAYLAGLCGALRLYHERLGAPVDTLPLAVPVNLRSADDPAGGNRFVGVTFAAPLAIADPAARIKDIREKVLARRAEPAINFVGAVAPALAALPDAVLELLSGSVVLHDVQASNVPTYPGDTYMAGAKVLRQYGIGPLPGVAMMVMLLSRAGTVTVTVRYDRAAFTDDAVLRECLQDGFNEVLALGGAGRTSVVTSPKALQKKSPTRARKASP